MCTSFYVSDHQLKDASPYVLSIRRQPQGARIRSGSCCIWPPPVVQLHVISSFAVSPDHFEWEEFLTTARLVSVDNTTDEVIDDRGFPILRGATTQKGVWLSVYPGLDAPPPANVALQTPVFFQFQNLTMHSVGQFRLQFNFYRKSDFPGLVPPVLASVVSDIFLAVDEDGWEVETEE